MSDRAPKNYSIQAYADYYARSIELQGFEGRVVLLPLSAKKELPAQALDHAHDGKPLRLL